MKKDFHCHCDIINGCSARCVDVLLFWWEQCRCSNRHCGTWALEWLDRFALWQVSSTITFLLGGKVEAVWVLLVFDGGSGGCGFWGGMRGRYGLGFLVLIFVEFIFELGYTNSENLKVKHAQVINKKMSTSIDWTSLFWGCLSCSSRAVILIPILCGCSCVWLYLLWLCRWSVSSSGSDSTDIVETPKSEEHRDSTAHSSYQREHFTLPLDRRATQNILQSYVQVQPARVHMLG